MITDQNSQWGIEKSLRRILWGGVLIATLLQMILFPSSGVFALCMMSLIVCFVYCNFFLKRDLFLQYPFASVVFIPVFLFRYLPPLATLLDGNPVTVGIMTPEKLAVLETLAFLSLSFAFFCAIRFQKGNKLRLLWVRLGLFESQNPVVYWIIGCIGVGCTYFSSMNFGDIEMGDAGGKFLVGLTYLRYVPLVMLCPSLFGLDQKKMPSKVYVYLWAFGMVVIGILSNGRKNMIIPIVIILLMLLLICFIRGERLSKMFNPAKAFFFIIFGLFFINVFSDFSLAMLNTRHIRQDVRGMDLLLKTIEVYSDDMKMEQLWKEKEREEAIISGYSEGWTETYVSNHFLNRYCNIRVSDESLYYAERANKEIMRGNFMEKVMSIFPTPMLKVFGVNLDKNNLMFSRGDFLYATATMTPVYPTYRVVSHVGDGMATFGFFCYVMFFLVYFIIFYLINNISCCVDGTPILSVVGGAYLADFMAFFGNGNGIFGEANFIMRKYWQMVLLYLVIVFVVSRIVKFFGIKG